MNGWIRIGREESKHNRDTIVKISSIAAIHKVTHSRNSTYACSIPKWVKTSLCIGNNSEDSVSYDDRTIEEWEVIISEWEMANDTRRT